MQRSDDRHLINVLAEFRENLADLDTALAHLGELERRRQRRAADEVHLLVGVLRHLRLRIPRVEMRRPALCENVDDMLGLGREMRLARRERVDDGAVGAAREALTEHRRHAQAGEAHAETVQETATRLKEILRLRTMLCNVHKVAFQLTAHWFALGPTKLP